MIEVKGQCWHKDNRVQRDFEIFQVVRWVASNQVRSELLEEIPPKEQ